MLPPPPTALSYSYCAGVCDCFICTNLGKSLVTGTGAQGWAHRWSRGYVSNKQQDSHTEHLISRTASPHGGLPSVWSRTQQPFTKSPPPRAEKTAQPSSSFAPHNNDNSYYLVTVQQCQAAGGLSLPLSPGVLPGPQETNITDFIFEGRGLAKNTQPVVCGEVGTENRTQSRVVCLARKETPGLFS